MTTYNIAVFNIYLNETCDFQGVTYTFVSNDASNYIFNNKILIYFIIHQNNI